MFFWWLKPVSWTRVINARDTSRTCVYVPEHGATCVVVEICLNKFKEHRPLLASDAKSAWLRRGRQTLVQFRGTIPSSCGLKKKRELKNKRITCRFKRKKTVQSDPLWSLCFTGHVLCSVGSKSGAETIALRLCRSRLLNHDEITPLVLTNYVSQVYALVVYFF